MVDVTTSLMRSGGSPIGITRVEGEIARRLLVAPDIAATPVVFRDGQIFALAPSDAERILVAGVGAAGVANELRLRPRSIAKPKADLPKRRSSTGVLNQAKAAMRRNARALIARMPDAVREDVRGILIHGRQIVRMMVSGQALPRPAVETSQALRDQVLSSLRVLAHPDDGDVLFTAGLYSNFVPLRAISELRAATGLRVASVCYDLIRVSWPEFNPRSMGMESFEADMVALLDASDFVFAISAWTQAELLAFTERSGRVPPAVEVVRLGGDPVAWSAIDRSVAPNEIIAQICSRSFALAVGTVEPRKNLGLLVRVWESLASDPSFDLDLVVVRCEGLESEGSAAEIEESPLFGRRIHWIDQCPDTALAWLYEHCHVVLCPSFAEGWGLPVSEALRRGRAVIASNRGAHSEAAMGLAPLLDPCDDAAWRARIANAAAAPRPSVAVPDLPSWDAAAADIAARLHTLLGMKRCKG